MTLSERGRSRAALLVAAVLHAFLLFAVREVGHGTPRAPSSPPPDADATLVFVEPLEDGPEPTLAALDRPAPDDELRGAVEHRAALRPGPAPRAPSEPGPAESTDADQGESGAQAPAPELPSPEPGSGQGRAARKAPGLTLEQLGIGEHNPFFADAARTIGDKPPPGEGIRHSLHDAIVKSDQARGLGPEGPVLTLLEAQTRASDSIMNGSALVRVITDGRGRVIGVELVEASSDEAAWRKVAQGLLEALRKVELRVPHGGRGVTLDVRVTSRVQLPSGLDPGTGVDILGIPLKKPGGKHSPHITILGFEPKGYVVKLPDGKVIKLPLLRLDKLLAVSGDLSDLSGKAQRLVHAHLERLSANESGGE